MREVHSHDVIDKNLQGLIEQDRRNIVHDNVAALHGIG